MGAVSLMVKGDSTSQYSFLPTENRFTLPHPGLEPGISTLGGLRLIHYASRAPHLLTWKVKYTMAVILIIPYWDEIQIQPPTIWT